MANLTLKNITIKKLQDRNSKDYYIIINKNNQDEAYFCFMGAVKNGWEELVNNWESIREVDIEYTENNEGFRIYRRVVSLAINYLPEI